MGTIKINKTTDNEWQIGRVANVIGIGFICMLIPAFFAEFAVRNGMIIWDDPILTFQTIKAELGKFELGILGFMIVLLIDVMVAAAFYQLVKWQNKSLALLMTSFRIVHICIKGAGMIGLVMARDLVKSTDALPQVELEFVARETIQLLKLHDLGFGMGLFFFGIHLILLAKMLFSIEWMSRFIAWMILASGVGFSINTLAYFFAGDVEWIQTSILIVLILPMTFAEMSLGIWLMAKKKKLREFVSL